MRAVVIGASGHVGSAIVRTLLERQYEVTACGRRSSPPINLAGLPITYMPGDAEAPDQFEKWIAGHDLVVDAAAPYPIEIFSPLVNPTSRQMSAAERRTRLLIEATAKHDACLLYVGSFVTITKPETAAQKMRAELFRLTHPYFSVKELIDWQLVEAARQGLRVVIASPTYCLGPWDLRDPEICAIPMLLQRRVPACVTSVINVIDVRDLARAALAAVEAQSFGEPLLMSGTSLSVREFYSIVCELADVPAPKLPISANLAILGAYLMEAMLGFAGQKAVLHSAGMAMATQFDFLERDCSIRDLDVEPRPLKETIWDSIRWYREIGYC